MLIISSFNYITSNLTYLFILPRTVPLVLHLTNDIILVIFKKYVSLVVAVSVLREQEKNWPCYECNRRFMSSEQLQQHLNMHDDKLNLIQRFECTSVTWFLRCSWLYSWQWVHCRIWLIFFSSRPKGRGRGRGRKRFSAARRPGRRTKFICPQTPVESADKTQVL